MITWSHKLSHTVLLWAAAVLIALVSGACSTSQPASTPLPTTSPGLITDTPEPTSATPEPAASEKAGGIIRPSATPAPTLTPGAITELISEFTQTQGLQDVTVFRVSVEDWLNLGYSILLILLIGAMFSRLVYYLLTKLAERTETRYDDQFVQQIRSQIYMILITVGFQVGTVRLDLIEALIKFRITRLYALIYVIAATVILWRLVDVLVSWYRNEVEPARNRQQVDNILLLLHRGARLLLVTISLIMVLSLYNVNVTALVAALGVGGLAISLAAQDTLSNVISGIMIMLDQPFRVGDRIEIPKMSTWGDVVDIGLRSTRIRTRDNRLVIVPNNTISTDQVINYTYPDPRYRIQIEIAIAYEQDIERVRQIIIDSVRQVEGVLVEKPVDALVVSMGEYAMTFRVRWWIHSYRDTRHMFDRVYTALLSSFEEAGIEMPTDSYDINIKNMPGDVNDKSQQD